MNTAHLGPALAVGVIAVLGVYRRMRRSIGRQPLRPGRLWSRIAVWALICALMTTALLRRHPAGTPAAIAAGAVLGIVLALVALRYTEFAFTPEGNFYTPHLYTGLAVTALLVARLAYRLVLIYTLQGAAPESVPGMAPGVTSGVGAYPPPAFSSPLTLAILFLTGGYYICYYGGVLRALHRQPAGAQPVVESAKP
ncbi:MAG TPA: hypothetical protein VMB48_16940 [Steroidobacteraceae bacterium]|nr:hypothetical protein [Steroidobacteraceae bacterium]